MGFVACEDGVQDSDATAPVNPQEAAFETSNLTVAAPAGKSLDLAALNAAGQACVVTTASAVNVPEGYNVAMVMEMAKDDTFEKVYPAETSLVDGNVTISPDVLNGIYTANITSDPRPSTLNVRFAPYMVSGSSKVLIGGPDYYVGKGTLTITPFKPAYVIEDEYYLIGTASNGAVTGGIKLTHSDKSPYDDPKFTIVVDITDDEAANGYQWAIVPASTVAAGSGLVYGCEMPDYSELTGALVECESTDINFGSIYESGPFSFSFNLKDLTFEAFAAVPMLYTPGNSNGWSQTASQILYTTDYVHYMGFAHLNGEFKFSTKPDWTGKNLGSTGVDGELTDDGGAGNLNAPKDGLYWVTVNYAELTYTLTYIDTLGVIGGMNGWSAQENLNPNANFLIWTGNVTLAAGQEFKFRGNDDWGVNLGGDQSDLSFDGSNLVTDKCAGWNGDGEYTFTLDLSAVPYSFKIVKQ